MADPIVHGLGPDVESRLQRAEQRTRWAVAGMMLVALAGGLCVTWAVSQSTAEREQAEGQVRFLRAHDRLLAEARRRLSMPEYGLKGARGAYASNQVMGRRDFLAYVQSRDLSAEFPGVHGFGVIEATPRDQLDAFLARQRADFAPDFAVQSDGVGEQLSVVTVIEPLAQNRELLGLDLNAEPRLRVALERAIETGLATLTPPVQLHRGEGGRTGMLMILPVFRIDRGFRTAAQRHDALRAFVFAPIIADELFAGTLSAGDGLIDLDIYDGTAKSDEASLYDPDGHLKGAPENGGRYSSDTLVEAGGRTLLMHTRSTPQFEATLSDFASKSQRTAGVALTLLLVLVAWLAGRSRTQALHLALRMTQELREAQRVADQQMREREALYRTIDQQFIVSTAGLDGLITSANDKLCEITGYGREELLGKNHRVLNSGVHPKAFWAEMWRTVASGHSWRNEVCNKKKDGSFYWVDALVEPIFGPQGKIEKYVSIRADITPRKHAEEALERQSRLATELAAKADEANRAKSSFLANMSHEIRTPMNGVLGMTELLLGMDLNPEQEEAARTVYRSAEGLLVILNDVLDFSKIEAGRLEFERLVFDAQQLVYDTVELFRGKVRDTPVELLVRIDAAAPQRVWGDPSRLRQVITNLVGNAVKFTAAGHVLLELERSGPSLVVRVSDTGPGIPLERQQVLFEPFTQADASTSRRFGGTGLGLAISRRLVAGLGGTITLESAPGAGTCFEVTLPLEEETPRPAPRVPALTGKRVLAVERLALQRRLVREQLEAEGAEVEVAVDTDGARAALVRGRFDAVLLSEATVEPVLATAPPRGTAFVLYAANTQRRGERPGLTSVVHRPVATAAFGKMVARAIATAQGATPEAAPVMATPQTLPPPREVKRRRVLVAEDNPVNQRIARAMLERLGCEVTLVEDGRAAVEAHGRGPWDVIFMDCQMPDLDGFEATSAIRAREAAKGLPRTPVVAMTANAMAEDRARCLAVGMDDHVPKPARALDLEAALTRWA